MITRLLFHKMIICIYRTCTKCTCQRLELSILKTKRINEPSLYILLSLTKAPLSGYEITRKVMEITNGRLDIKTGTMYPTLKKLMDQEYIEMVNVEKIERNKKIYRLTIKGEKIVRAEEKLLEEKLLEIKLALKT